jgi:SAM-dependent methyltransferase
MSIDVGAFKQGQKAMWTAGDYPEIALRIVTVGEYLAERAGAAPGVELLDVASGTGNVSIPAARLGASVTALDLTPKLLEAQRARAAAEGVDVELVEGDAEELPFEADSFDRVTSCFGVMFAPRQKVAAQELVRVARPGGSIVVAAWTPDGFIGRTFSTTARYMPAPPADLKPPVMWGDEEHVRGLFEGTGVAMACERRKVTFEGDSAKAWQAEEEQKLGPAVMAKAVLEPQGRWEDLQRDMLAMYEDFNSATDGSFRVEAEYLVTIAERPAS